ncbi:FACT complex subunit Ssrp1-like [Ostrea edulis]|uniref:FACT complex subunit Ssrp1-like n=1 Tax=Ostrea edulis TaxID=37623 RepID=UPI0024AF284D|nr:FACT complex subunit Ssrp1-like [Ostrea edulis]
MALVVHLVPLSTLDLQLKVLPRPKESGLMSSNKSMKTFKEGGMLQFCQYITSINSFIIHFQRERLPLSERKKRKSKSKKDPNAPKKPLSAYVLWLNANRKEMMKENPEKSITSLVRRAGELWKQLEDKTEWNEKAAEAKKAYEKAMEEYRSNAAKQEAGLLDDNEESAKKRKSPKKSPMSKSVSDSRAGPGSNYERKNYISSSGDSSGSDSNDNLPLKKKSKKEDISKEKKKEKGEDKKRKSKQ